ncbi:MAG: phosphoribosylanthranilate isomerase [Acidobacteriota bacterium]|jgi:phosphoribosylanthranilate isomerase|nr:phosphoribosylanthranilate isomerase [Acidobacteriota bacterium]
MVFVKICGITNLEDARAAVDAGADALGFNFYRRSPRFIAPVDARDIIEQLPETVMSVGVFVNEGEPEQVERIADLAGLKAVQLHGDESPQYCRELRDRFVIKALRVGQGFAPQSVKEYETNAILLDAFAGAARGGTGRVIDWSIARQVRELVPQLFLAGGLSVENVAEAITIVEPYAVDVCSSLEQEPGRKDAGRVRAFVAAAHVKP